MITNEMITRLAFKTDLTGARNYDRHMRQMQREAERVSRRMGNMKVKLTGVDAAQRELGGLNRTVSKVMGNLKLLAAGFIGFQGLKSAGTFIMGAASEYETAITQLTTLVGAQKAPAIFADLQKFAATTPYELKDVMQMFTRLEGAGFQLIGKDGKVDYKAITKFGDLAAASNKPLSEFTDMALSLSRGLGSMADNFVGLSAKAEDGALSVEMFDRASGKTLKNMIKVGDKLAVKDYLLGAGGRAGIAGGMEAMSKTLSGQTSTLVDSLKSLSVSFFKGFGAEVHKGLAETIKQLDKMGPTVEKIGKGVGKFIKDLPGYVQKTKDAFKALTPILAAAGIAFGIVKTHAIGLMVMSSAGSLVKMVGVVGLLAGRFRLLIAVIRMGGLSTLLPILAAGWAGVVAAMTPLLVGGALIGAIVAIGALGYALFQYWTKGDKALDGLRKKFPMLADGIKFLGDKSRDFAYKHLIPAIKNSKVWFDKFVEDWLVGAAKISESATSLAGDYDYWMANTKNYFNFIRETADWILSILEKLPIPMRSVFEEMRKFNGWMGHGQEAPQGSGPNGQSANMAAGGGGAAMLKSIGFDTATAAAMGRNARMIYSGAKQCLNGVWKIQNKVLNGRSPISEGLAYQAVQSMSKSPLFKEITGVTPEMLKDPNFLRMMNGATIIYDRAAGFSPTAGHAEVLDAVTGKVHYGNGPGEAISRRSRQNIQHARFYLPSASGGGQMPAAALIQASQQGGRPTATVNVTVNAQGSSPTQTRQAVDQGTTQALHKAGLGSKPTASPRR